MKTPIASASPRVSVVEALTLALCFGLTVGTLFGACDGYYHVENGLPVDVVVAAAFSVAFAAPALLVIGLILVVGLLPAGRLSARAPWAALLACVAAIVLVAGLVLVGTTHYRDWRGLIALGVALPLCIVAGQGVARIPDLARPGRAIVWSLAVAMTILVGVCGMASVRAFGLPGVLKAAPPVFAVALLVAATRAARRAPIITAVALLVLLPAVAGAFAAYGSPRPPVPPPASPRGGDARPNVVLIVLDTTRRDALGCYGGRLGLTPELDRLAAEGVVYEDAISAGPWTMPSHASMFTGLYQISHGCASEYSQWLDDDAVTVAEKLRGDGYETMSLTANPWLTACNLLQGFDRRVELGKRFIDAALRPLAYALGRPDNWIDKGGAEAADLCQGMLARRARPRAPLLFFVNLFEPHERYLPPAAERAAFLPPGVGAVQAARFGYELSNMALHAVGETDARVRKMAQALYHAEVRYQDCCLGRLLAVLRRSIDWDNTLLIITADHGENLGEAGRWGHLHAINDTLLHVPLIIRYPKSFPPGRRVAGLCQLVDLPPTIDGVLGRTTDRALPGRSLAPDGFVPRDAAFAELTPHHSNLGVIEQTLGRSMGVAKFDAVRRVVRTASYEYVWSSRNDHELYDLAADPLEERNVVLEKPEQAARMQQMLSDWLKAQPVYVRRPRAEKPRAIHEAGIKHLRSLGYMN